MKVWDRILADSLCEGMQHSHDVLGINEMRRMWMRKTVREEGWRCEGIARRSWKTYRYYSVDGSSAGATDQGVRDGIMYVNAAVRKLTDDGFMRARLPLRHISTSHLYGEGS